MFLKGFWKVNFLRNSTWISNRETPGMSDFIPRSPQHSVQYSASFDTPDQLSRKALSAKFGVLEEEHKPLWTSRKLLTYSQTSHASEGSHLNCLQLTILLPEFYVYRPFTSLFLSLNQNNGMTQLLAQVTEVESLTRQVLQRSGKPKDNMSS